MGLSIIASCVNDNLVPGMGLRICSLQYCTSGGHEAPIWYINHARFPLASIRWCIGSQVCLEEGMGCGGHISIEARAGVQVAV